MPRPITDRYSIEESEEFKQRMLKRKEADHREVLAGGNPYGIAEDSKTFKQKKAEAEAFQASLANITHDENPSFKASEGMSRNEQYEELKRRQGTDKKGRPISQRQQQAQEVMEYNKSLEDKRRGVYVPPDENFLRRQIGGLDPDEARRRRMEFHKGDTEKVDADLRAAGVEVPEGRYEQIDGVDVRVTADGKISPVYAEDQQKVSASLASKRRDTRGMSDGKPVAFGQLSKRGKGHIFGTDAKSITGRTLEQNRLAAEPVAPEQGDIIKTEAQINQEARRDTILGAVDAVRQEGKALSTDDLEAAATSLAEKTVAQSGVEFDTDAARARAIDIETQKAKKDMSQLLSENIVAGQQDLPEISEEEQLLVNTLSQLGMEPIDAGQYVKDFIDEQVALNVEPRRDGEDPKNFHMRQDFARQEMLKRLAPYLPEDIAMMEGLTDEEARARQISIDMHNESDGVKQIITELGLGAEEGVEVNGSKFKEMFSQAAKLRGIDLLDEEAINTLAGEISRAIKVTRSTVTDGARGFAINELVVEARYEDTLGESGRALLDKYGEDGMTLQQFHTLSDEIEDAIMNDNVDINGNPLEKTSAAFQTKYAALKSVLHTALVTRVQPNNLDLDVEQLQGLGLQAGTIASDYANLFIDAEIMPTGDEIRKVVPANMHVLLGKDGFLSDEVENAIINTHSELVSMGEAALVRDAKEILKLKDEEITYLMDVGKLPDFDEERLEELGDIQNSDAFDQWVTRKIGFNQEQAPYRKFVESVNKITEERDYDSSLKASMTARVIRDVFEGMTASEMDLIEDSINSQLHPDTATPSLGKDTFVLPNLDGIFDNPDIDSGTATKDFSTVLDASVNAVDWLESGSGLEGMDAFEVQEMAQAIVQFAGATASQFGIREGEKNFDSALSYGLLSQISQEGAHEQVLKEMNDRMSQTWKSKGVDVSTVKELADKRDEAASVGIELPRRAAILQAKDIKGTDLADQPAQTAATARALMAWAIHPADGISKEVWEEHGLGDEYNKIIMNMHNKRLDGEWQPISGRDVSDPLGRVYDLKMSRSYLGEHDDARAAVEVAAKVLLMDSEKSAAFLRLINADLEGRGGSGVEGTSISDTVWGAVGWYTQAGKAAIGKSADIGHLVGRANASDFALPNGYLKVDKLSKIRKGLVDALWR